MNINLYKLQLKCLKSENLFLMSGFCIPLEYLMNNHSEYINSFYFNLSKLCVIINNTFLVPLMKENEINYLESWSATETFPNSPEFS